MEAENLRTCASCKHKKERVLRGHRITVESFCEYGRRIGSKGGDCERYASRFEKMAVKLQMEVELL